MKFYIVAIFALLSPILARPQNEQQPQQYSQQRQQGGGSTPASIVSQTESVGPDGTFNYSFDTSDGVHVEQGGYIKQAAEARNVDPNNPEETGDIQVIQGAYSYTAPDGQQISVKYVADDNGFQPEGEHIPKAPGAPEGQGVNVDQRHGQQQQRQYQQQQPQGQQYQQQPQGQQYQQQQPQGQQYQQQPQGGNPTSQPAQA